MPVESANYISTLDATLPAADNPVAEGDDHLRLIKAVLKATFPALSAPVTATAADLNTTAGLATRVTTLEGAVVRTTGNQVIAGTLSTTGLFENGNRLLPAGCIVMWGGLVANIPAGWVLCNGANGTPDLRDRFVIGAGNALAPGSLVGANALSVSTASAGAHNHGGTSLGGAHGHIATTDTQGAHAHGGATAGTGLTVDQLPQHTHSLSLTTRTGNQANANNSAGWGGDNVVAGPYTATTDGGAGLAGSAHAHTIPTDGAHAHGVAVQVDPGHSHAIPTDGAHTHTVSFDNRPASFALCFIMKT